MKHRRVHWADAVTQDVLPTRSQHLLSTGITPSGEYHVGHLREILTAEAIYRALLDHGATVHMHYIADTMDPLRRVYDFLDPARVSRRRWQAPVRYSLSLWATCQAMLSTT